MKLELDDEQRAALLRELDRIIEDDRFPFSDAERDTCQHQTLPGA